MSDTYEFATHRSARGRLHLSRDMRRPLRGGSSVES